MSDGIIDYERRMRGAEALLDASPISDINKFQIERFLDFKVAQRVSSARQEKYARILRLIAERYIEGKDFEQLTRDDVIHAVAQIERSDLKAWTKYDYEFFLKTFLTWLGKEETVEWIRVRPVKRKPDDVLTYKDVMKMIDAAYNPRDRALIAMLFETGARIAEIGNLTRGDLEFEQFSATALVKGKTGIYRIYFVWSLPYLSQWLEAHPLHEDTAPLWVYLHGAPRRMRYDVMNKQLANIARRAGIEKRVNPHNFRHTRLTLYSKERKLSEAMIKELMGLSPNSRVLDVYRHLTGEDIRNAVLDMHGLQPKEMKEEKAQIRQCPVCHAINTDAAVTCISCHRPLKVEAVLDLEARSKQFLINTMELLAKDPDMMEKFKAMMKKS